MSAGWVWEVRSPDGAWRTVRASEGMALIEGSLQQSRYGRWLTLPQVVNDLRQRQAPREVYGPDGLVWLVQCTERLPAPRRKVAAGGRR